MAQTVCKRLEKLHRSISAAVSRMRDPSERESSRRTRICEYYSWSAQDNIDNFDRRRQDLPSCLFYTPAGVVTGSDFRLAVEMIDEIFFGGELGRHLEVRFDNIAKENTLGWTDWKVNDDGSPRLLIVIDARKHTSERDFLETLSHEMCHAYVELHTCYCGGVKCKEWKDDIYQIGVDGHGLQWQVLASAVEDGMKELWRENFDMGRERAAYAEVIKSVSGWLDDGNLGKVLNYLKFSFDHRSADQMLQLLKVKYLQEVSAGRR